MSTTPVSIQNFYWNNSVILSSLTESALVGMVSFVGLRCLSYANKNSNFFLSNRSIALVAGTALLTILAKNWKGLLFEISLLFTSRNRLPWWHEIDENLVLGAIPLIEHKAHLTSLRITAVFSILDIHEYSTKFVKILFATENLITSTPDFQAVDPEDIQEAVNQLVTWIKAGHKVYVHSKAGRGRSASIVVAYCMRYGIPENRTPSLEQAIAYVKGKRPQISLNPRQQEAIIEWFRRFNGAESDGCIVKQLDGFMRPIPSFLSDV